MQERFGRDDAGMALLVAALFVSVALVALGAIAMQIMNQSVQVQKYMDFENCMFGVGTGLAECRAEVEAGEDGRVGVSRAYEVGQGFPGFDSADVSPLEVPDMPEIEYYAMAQPWSGDGVDNNGDAVTDGPEELGYFTLYSAARTGGVVRRAETVLRGADINVWRNAIFAGAGHVDGAVQGNCSIHGSVHILGNHVVEGGEAVVVLDLMGASLIHNNYGFGAGPGPALPDYLRDRVPAEELITVNGEADQATLNAELRVKNGLVSVNSSSEIGAAEVAGNGVKDSMDGVYNNDGWTGQRTVDDGDRGDPTVVFSDNGWDEMYDCGDRVPFPMLSDDWRWPASVECYELGYPFTGEPGGKELAPDGTYYAHDAFFADELSDGSPYSGDVTITVGTDFYMNLTQPSSAPADRVKADPATCTKGDDYIYYDSATDVMEINGQIEIDGDLTLAAGKGNKGKTINYTGRAAILAHGNVTVNADLLTCNDGDPTDYLLSFPERNIIGIMAEQDMVLGEHAQLDLMGAFYAQGEISSDKQTVVMGTFVAEYFDMGQQVPDIYQVPTLADNLPLGMIANYPVMTFFEVSWRELP